MLTVVILSIPLLVLTVLVGALLVGVALNTAILAYAGTGQLEKRDYLCGIAVGAFDKVFFPTQPIKIVQEQVAQV